MCNFKICMACGSDTTKVVPTLVDQLSCACSNCGFHRKITVDELPFHDQKTIAQQIGNCTLLFRGKTLGWAYDDIIFRHKQALSRYLDAKHISYSRARTQLSKRIDITSPQGLVRIAGYVRGVLPPDQRMDLSLKRFIGIFVDKRFLRYERMVIERDPLAPWPDTSNMPRGRYLINSHKRMWYIVLFKLGDDCVRELLTNCGFILTDIDDTSGSCALVDYAVVAAIRYPRLLAIIEDAHDKRFPKLGERFYQIRIP